MLNLWFLSFLIVRAIFEPQNMVRVAVPGIPGEYYLMKKCVFTDFCCDDAIAPEFDKDIDELPWRRPLNLNSILSVKDDPSYNKVRVDHAVFNCIEGRDATALMDQELIMIEDFVLQCHPKMQLQRVNLGPRDFGAMNTRNARESAQLDTIREHGHGRSVDKRWPLQQDHFDEKSYYDQLQRANINTLIYNLIAELGYQSHQAKYPEDFPAYFLESLPKNLEKSRTGVTYEKAFCNWKSAEVAKLSGSAQTFCTDNIDPADLVRNAALFAFYGPRRAPTAGFNDRILPVCTGCRRRSSRSSDKILSPEPDHLTEAEFLSVYRLDGSHPSQVFRKHNVAIFPLGLIDPQGQYRICARFAPGSGSTMRVIHVPEILSS